jgi:hypothetical protein
MKGNGILMPSEDAPSSVDPSLVREHLKRLVLVYADGSIDTATYQEQRAKLRAQLATAEAGTEAQPIDDHNITTAVVHRDAFGILMGTTAVYCVDGVPDGLRAFRPIRQRPFEFLWLSHKQAA